MASTTGEKEKQLLAETVQERLIGKKNSVLFKELLDDKIPTFLKNYLQNAVRKIVHTEEPIQFKNSKRFDFEYQKISQLRISLIKAFEEATVFSREELSEIINKTVSLQFDLLVRPNSTLLKIFYKDKSDRIQNEILQILGGLGDNRIFIKNLIKNIKEFDQYHIVEDDFKKLLQQTEKQIFQQNFLATFISEVRNFSEFLGMIRGCENQKINVEFVKLLLEERSLNGYSAIFDFYEKETIDIEGLILLFKNYAENGKNEGQKSETDDIDNFLFLSMPEERKSDLVDFTQNNTKNTAANNSEGQNQEKKKPTRNKINKVTIISSDDPYNQIIERSQIEKQPEGPIEPLIELIEEKEAKFLIKRVFNSRKTEYDKFIERLEAIDNWKKAKEIIDVELNLRGIKPFSKEALKLGDLVFNRYFPERHA